MSFILFIRDSRILCLISLCSIRLFYSDIISLCDVEVSVAIIGSHERQSLRSFIGDNCGVNDRCCLTGLDPDSCCVCAYSHSGFGNILTLDLCDLKVFKVVLDLRGKCIRDVHF